MIVHYDYGVDDYIAGQGHLSERSPGVYAGALRMRRKVLLMLAAVAAMIGGGSLAAGSISGSTARVVVIFSAVVVVRMVWGWMWSFTRVGASRYRAKMREHVHRSLRGAVERGEVKIGAGPVRLEVGEEGLQVTDVDCSTLYFWHAIEAIERGASHIFLALRHGTVLPVPIRAFDEDGGASAEEFVSLVEAERSAAGGMEGAAAGRVVSG